jgi:pimeloyl-ACP methyl ester carboxylesterase
MTPLALALAVVAPTAGSASAAPVASGYAPLNGLRVYYELHGPAGGTPLVLLHGGGSSIETSFGRTLPALAKTRRVVAFDQQGHGRTADIDRPFTFEGSADDAAALLRHLGIAKADLMGFSNGGSIAMQAAIRHPELVRRLVIVSAMVRRDGMRPGFWDGMQRATLADMPPELQEAYRKTSPHPERLQSFHDKSVQRMLAFRDWPEATVRSISAPALVVVGDDDVVRPEHAVEMARLLPHARLAVLPLTDHAAMVGAHAGWLMPLVEAFLDASAP